MDTDAERAAFEQLFGPAPPGLAPPVAPRGSIFLTSFAGLASTPNTVAALLSAAARDRALPLWQAFTACFFHADTRGSEALLVHRPARPGVEAPIVRWSMVEGVRNEPGSRCRAPGLEARARWIVDTLTTGRVPMRTWDADQLALDPAGDVRTGRVALDVPTGLYWIFRTFLLGEDERLDAVLAAIPPDAPRLLTDAAAHVEALGAGQARLPATHDLPRLLDQLQTAVGLREPPASALPALTLRRVPGALFDPRTHIRHRPPAVQSALTHGDKTIATPGAAVLVLRSEGAGWYGLAVGDEDGVRDIEPAMRTFSQRHALRLDGAGVYLPDKGALFYADFRTAQRAELLPADLQVRDVGPWPDGFALTTAEALELYAHDPASGTPPTLLWRAEAPRPVRLRVLVPGRALAYNTWKQETVVLGFGPDGPTLLGATDQVLLDDGVITDEAILLQGSGHVHRLEGLAAALAALPPSDPPALASSELHRQRAIAVLAT